MGKISFEIIAGSYEEFLLGYNYSSKAHVLTQSFAAHDHSASIRCVALSGHYLASGAADDRIFVYDMKARKEHCSLTHHNGTITCLQFTDNHSHLISGSSDGVLAILRVGNWQVEKVWEKAHKGAAILDIAVHSSGKLALTLGADASLCTWNLIKGRQAYIINLNSKSKDAKSLEKILWAPDGVRFLLYGGKYTEIWSIETGGPLQQIEHEEKVTSGAWLNNTILLIGHENGQITIVDNDDDTKKNVKAHESRVKYIACHKNRVITISSGGGIKVWDKNFYQEASIDTGCRLTCLCIVPRIKVKELEEDEEKTAKTDCTTEKQIKKITKPQLVVVEESDHEEEIKTINKKKKRKSDVIWESNKEKKKGKNGNNKI